MSNVDKVKQLLDEAQAKYDTAIINHLDELAEQIDALSGWVSVEDRLPEDEYQILIGCFYQKSQEIVVGTYHINHNLFYYDNDEFIAGVTHWQPLPEPPNPS